MNILFVANRFPYPPFRGDKLKIYNLAKRLSENNTLYLVTFIQDKNDYQHLPELEKIFKEIKLVYLPARKSYLNLLYSFFSKVPYQVSYFRSRKFKKLVDEFVATHDIDVIHTQHLRMAPYTVDIDTVPTILDLPDAFSLYWERRTQIKRNFFYSIFDKVEYKKVKNYEAIVKQFDFNLVCSPEDKAHIEKLHGIKNIDVLPNGVDLSAFTPRNHDYSHNNRIVFTGNMDYAPNVDAVIYFVKEIFPKVLEKFPDVKFYIVGQRPIQKVLDLQSDKIIITGFVEDLGEEYNKSSITIAPIRFGAGTQNKVLESMAMGVPVVCSNVGFKGLGVESSEGAFLAETTEKFTQTVIDLLGSAELREKVGKKGTEVIHERFNWDNIANQLLGYFKNLSA